MQFKLENPQHQKSAIQSVVEVFRGMERNTIDRYKSRIWQKKVSIIHLILLIFVTLQINVI